MAVDQDGDKEADAMYQQYRDLPRIDDPVPMLARQRLQELRRQADQVRLARLAGADRFAVPAPMFALARRVLHTLWAGIRRKVRRGGVGMPADQALPPPEAY